MIKRHLLQRFCKSQRNVDKTYKKSKRKFQREQQDEIKKLNSGNPKIFWDKIKSLGLDFFLNSLYPWK